MEEKLKFWIDDDDMDYFIQIDGDEFCVEEDDKNY